MHKLRILAVLPFLFATSASAQILVDHQTNAGSGGFLLTPALSFSEIEYDIDGGGEAEIERTLIGVALAYGLHPSFDIYGEAAYIAEAEFENARGDGEGLLVGAGFDGEFYRSGRLQLRWLGGIHLISEDYGSGTDGDLFEVLLGASARGQLTPEFGLYGGLDIVPVSEGEIDPRRGGDIDFDRDNRVGIRFGADYTFPNAIRLNGEVAAVSEEAFTLRLTLPLY